MKKFALLLVLIIAMFCVSACSGKLNEDGESEEKYVPFQSDNQNVDSKDDDQDATSQPDEIISPGDNINGMKFSSAEAAYYHKYVELAEKYGTHTLYDVKPKYSGRSYLNGVCVVNLMDFNGDGIQDLFIVYSNGQMKKVIDDGYDLEIYDFPDKDTYKLEIWTYIDGGLTQILHESSVSTRNIYPNQISDYLRQFFQLFITVYENEDGLPVIQIYNESDEGRNYTNIYYLDGGIARDQLMYNGNVFQMNGLEITENTWSERIAGYNKLLLCSLLADSWSSSDSGYYNNTLLQTPKVIRYLSQEDKAPIIPRFNIAEGEYISLYLREIDRANRLPLGSEYTENHYFALYDMDQNGVPELILYEGTSGAGTHHHFYTVIDGEIADCGDYGRANLNVDGEGGLIAYFARMNGYDIKKIALNSDTILITDIASGYTQDDYPMLEEFGYYNYEYLDYCPPVIPLALYMYNQDHY